MSFRKDHAMATVSVLVAPQSKFTGKTHTGTDKDDRLTGDAGNDRFYGSKGDDRLRGNDGNDLLYGGSGDDRMKAGDGNDMLIGGLGQDRLDGDEGNDRVYGGGGMDTMTGGDGRDTLHGGSGADVFVFSNTDKGTTYVKDYQRGVDHLQNLISDSGKVGWRDFMANTEQQGRHAVYENDGFKFVLLNVNYKDLQVSDFVDQSL